MLWSVTGFSCCAAQVVGMFAWLISEAAAPSSSLLRAVPLDERQSAAELDAILQHHHNLQEKLAEEMLNLARNLKNNTLAQQNIIKQDNQVGASTHKCIGLIGL